MVEEQEWAAQAESFKAEGNKLLADKQFGDAVEMCQFDRSATPVTIQVDQLEPIPSPNDWLVSSTFTMMEVELMAHNPGLLGDNFLSCKLSPTRELPNPTGRVKRMKYNPLIAPTFDERLAGVFSFYEAIPVLDEYLSSIQIDDDDPGFALDWEFTNVIAFVEVANNQPAVNAPWWMRTLPPNITVETFTYELVSELARVAGGRCGRLMLAPNTLAQFCAVAMILAHIQANAFMQNVGQIALPVIDGVERHLATTYSLTDTKAQRSTLNTLPRPPAGLRLFI